MDTISAASTLAWAMEANEKGLWDNGLEFGKTKNISKTFEDVAFRRGIGNELAEGSKRLSEKYGGKEFAIHSKGLELAAYEPRRAVGQGSDPAEILSSFYMKDISRQIKLGKTPTSNTKTLELINVLVAQMIGKVGKATNHDLVVLDGDYAKQTGDMLTRRAATNSKFIEMMMTICHRIVTNGSYKLECKLKK